VEAVLVAAFVALVFFARPHGPEDMVVVLPAVDGHVGSVVVEREGERTVLDQPFAASRSGQKAPIQLTEGEARQTFGVALAAIPSRPARFALYFETATDQLTEESKAELARMLEELKRRPAPDILVIGHTDTVGQTDENDHLSRLRAERVKADLVSQGIPAERIRASGRGEREPVVATADGVDEPRNRRVEINVR
jgi:outer membrane protein OmpA-like peptidoglycan-associated protein